MSYVAIRNLASALVLSAGVGLSGPTFAAPPTKPKGDEALDRIGRIATVAAQKAENDVRVAVMAAQTSKTREKAIEILTAIKGKIEDNQALPEARRTSLVKMLDSRIKALEAGPDPKALTEKDIERTIRRLEKQVDDDKKQAEQKRLQKGLKEVLDLQQNGKFQEAKAKSEELTREFPSNPAVVASRTTMSGIENLVALRTIRSDKAKGFDNAIRDIDRSAVLPKGDVEFPKDWKQKSEYRLKKYGPVKLSPKEQAIVAALSRPISVDFKGDRFEDVMQYLSTLINQPILIDRNDLKEAQIDYETPVNLAVKGVTLRTILRKILGEFGLTYIVKDETIQVVSQAKARETMVIRAYPVGDLLGVGGGPGDPLTNFFGPGIGQIQRMQNVANLLQMIQTTVDPNSWQINGGPGTVAFDYATMSMVIKNSAEVHAMMGGGYLR
jgi:hypothetical protein